MPRPLQETLRLGSGEREGDALPPAEAREIVPRRPINAIEAGSPKRASLVD
jgi:hypothetical protein